MKSATKYSKTGIILASIYLIFTAGFAIYIAACQNIYCKAFIVIPVLPWAAISEALVKQNILLYLLLVTLNASIFYFIGYFAQKALSQMKKSK